MSLQMCRPAWPSSLESQHHDRCDCGGVLIEWIASSSKRRMHIVMHGGTIMALCRDSLLFNVVRQDEGFELEVTDPED